MLRHILIPLDGSELAERAIPVVARIARATEGSAISLVRIVRAPAEFETSATATAVWAPAADEDEKREANNYLHEVAQRPELAGVAVTERIYAGPPSATLLMAAKSLGVDLIVMTSRGRSGITRWLLGSVAGRRLARVTSAYLDRARGEGGGRDHAGRRGAGPGGWLAAGGDGDRACRAPGRRARG